MSLDQVWNGLWIAAVLMAVVTLVHFSAMEALRAAATRMRLGGRWMIFAGVFALFLVHTLEIGIFAGAYYWLAHHVDEPLLDRDAESFPQLFHFSATTYTTLGMSTADPQGIAKILAPMEALTGFMMITWSATFTYSATSFWEEDETEEDEQGAAD